MTATANTTRARLKADVRPFRPVAVQLLKMAGDPSAPFGKLAALVQTDPVLAMELLKMANSPLFRRRVEIESVLQAIVFLGSDMVSSLVLTACLKALVPTRSNRFILACWRHGLATALICQRLARPMHLHESNAYTAGLIHDIGQLALLNVFPSYEEALIAGEEMGVDILAVEKDLFGLDHGEAGRWLLAEWGCPLVLQEVAGKHENPPLAEPRDTGLIRLVHAGSELANLMGMSAAAPARHGDIAQIAATLPEASGELTAEGFGYLSESIITKVNGVELSLGFGMGQ